MNLWDILKRFFTLPTGRNILLYSFFSSLTNYPLYDEDIVK